ncbi:T9SS type A sorting domain-containing protein [Labilibacter marinus]|uniref:T9SS type A sorting domain-containing protein n=1 Tax=Labilibacter marinus TaxID=1477105 RepID=UPI00082C3DD6|nr:T9SS type A sorting domain-containing protein [Labilibacter marinus]
MIQKYTFILLIAASLGLQAMAQNEADFYTEPSTYGVVKNLVDDYHADGSDDEDDSAALRSAIADVTATTNGGKIIIPAGTYYFTDVQMNSNVHIEINKDAIIKPAPVSDTKNHRIFDFTNSSKVIKNVSIQGVDGSFTVDLRNLSNKNFAVVRFNNAENFLLSNFIVQDDITKFSCVTFGYGKIGDTYYSPTNGVIKNLTAYNQHYGYGVIQSQASVNVLFKNLWGDGGVTLRLETGYDKMNELQVGGNFDTYGRDIYCENGNAAYMMSPHAIQNGHVDIDGVTAVNCGFAVRIGDGYVKKDQEEIPGIQPGTYASTSVVKNVTATYGATAQVKSKHFKYMPCVLRSLIAEDYNPDGESYSAPAISAVINTAEHAAEGTYHVETTNVSNIGFAEQPHAIVYYEVDCDENSIANNQYSKSIKVFPNPFKQSFTVDVEHDFDFNEIQILNMHGKIVHSESFVGSTQNLQVDLAKGMYCVKLIGKNKVGVKTIIKN